MTLGINFIDKILENYIRSDIQFEKIIRKYSQILRQEESISSLLFLSERFSIDLYTFFKEFLETLSKSNEEKMLGKTLIICLVLTAICWESTKACYFEECAGKDCEEDAAFICCGVQNGFCPGANSCSEYCTHGDCNTCF